MKLYDPSLVVVCAIVTMILTGHLLIRIVTNYHSLEPQKRYRECTIKKEKKLEIEKRLKETNELKSN